MADNETAERWTVPQACVWIYTRDLATMRELDPRAALSLSVAALAMPSVFDASACLLAALGRGYPTARARLEETDGYIPQTFWNDGGRFTDSPDHGVVIVAPGGQGSWTNVAVEADDCMGLWPSPAAILGDGVLSMGQAVAELEPEPIDHPRWLLTHPAVIVTGLNDRGERVTIDAAALARGVVDCEADTLTDGRLIWSSVTLDLAPAEPAPVASAAGLDPAPPPSAPDRPTPEHVAWYQQRVRDHDPQQPLPSREDDTRAAEKYFEIGGLKDIVRELRREHAPARWRQPGPRGRKLAARAARS